MSDPSRKNNILLSITGNRNLSINTQQVDLGDLSLSPLDVGTRFGRVSFGDDIVELSEINITYYLTENLEVWEDLTEWAIDIAIRANDAHLTDKEVMEIIYLDVHNQPKIRIKLFGVQPTMVENLDFDVNDDTPSIKTVSFKYHSFEYENLITGRKFSYGR